jgi:predicted enzyme involved in methoxymalonyl-ACP biosynthesis
MSPHEEILQGNQVEGRKYELREEAQNRGTLDAVYKISTGGGQTHWLKDQAVLEHFKPDNIMISLGNLCIVTKEMEAEEHLKQTQEALRKSEQSYRTQAIHDNLTGLYNTRYLYSALSDLIKKTSKTRNTVSPMEGMSLCWYCPVSISSRRWKKPKPSVRESKKHFTFKKKA